MLSSVFGVKLQIVIFPIFDEIVQNQAEPSVHLVSYLHQ